MNSAKIIQYRGHEIYHTTSHNGILNVYTIEINGQIYKGHILSSITDGIDLIIKSKIKSKIKSALKANADNKTKQQ